MALTKVTNRLIAGSPANVNDFGADPTGTSDSTAAFTAALAASSKIYVPSGTYLIDDQIDLEDDTNICIFGDGPELTTLKKPNNATRGNRIIYIEGASEISIKDLKIDGNGSNQNEYSKRGQIEIWNTSSDITISNVKIENAATYGIYIKGATADGHPLNVMLDRVQTSGSLGYDAAGVLGNRGKTGIALISAQEIMVRNGRFDDLFDVEPNVTDQIVTGQITGCVFNAGADFGALVSPSVYDVLIIDNNTFYASTTRSSYLIGLKGGLFTNNLVTQYKSGAVVTGASEIGIGIQENNAGNFSIVGNRIDGFKIGIAVGIMNKSVISSNLITHSSNGSSVSFDSKTFNRAAISIASASPIRGGQISDNKINLASGLTAAGQYGIDNRSSDTRSIQITGNTVMEDDTTLAKIYSVVTRSYADYIADNNATLETQITGSNNVVSYKNNRFVIDGAVRTAAPSGGTFAVGDRALVTNATDSSGVAGENFDEWYYTSGDGSSTAQWTKSGTIA